MNEHNTVSKEFMQKILNGEAEIIDKTVSGSLAIDITESYVLISFVDKDGTIITTLYKDTKEEFNVPKRIQIGNITFPIQLDGN